jgi:hypothetical protein
MAPDLFPYPTRLVSAASMDTVPQHWFRVVLIVAAAYLIIGFGFADIGNNASSSQIQRFWRVAAWGVSFVVFVAHIRYEHSKFHNAAPTTALHASLAAAIASFGLAVSANIHAQFVTSGNPTMLALSLLLWPILTMVPAFGVAFIIASGLARWWKKT